MHNYVVMYWYEQGFPFALSNNMIYITAPAGIMA